MNADVDHDISTVSMLLGSGGSGEGVDGGNSMKDR